MSEQLPERVDPVRLALNGAVLRGQLPFSACGRLLEFALNPDGRIDLELVFGREDGVTRVRGRVEATVRLQCQRCLEPVDLTVRCNVSLGVVASLAEADRLPEDCEPLIREGEGPIAVADLVEDEIILALPYIPRHPACGTGESAPTDEAGKS